MSISEKLVIPLFPVSGGNVYAVLAYVLASLIGLCVGSFLNVVIYRVPRGESVAFPPSHCPVCGERIKWYDNIPIFSYLILRGRCRSCKARISFRYTAVEAANMFLYLACAVIFKDNLIYAVISAVVCSVSVCVFFIDLEYMLIFDRFQIILALCGIVSVFTDTGYSPLSHLLGAASGFAVFMLISLIFGKITGEEALGGGDIKLAAVSGLLLGWQKLILMILISSVSASVILLILQRGSKNEGRQKFPFAPFLCSGLIISLLLGNEIIKWYISLFNI